MHQGIKLHDSKIWFNSLPLVLLRPRVIRFCLSLKVLSNKQQINRDEFKESTEKLRNEQILSGAYLS